MLRKNMKNGNGNLTYSTNGGNSSGSSQQGFCHWAWTNNQFPPIAIPDRCLSYLSHTGFQIFSMYSPPTPGIEPYKLFRINDLNIGL
jgi:hypothetical protein